MDGNYSEENVSKISKINSAALINLRIHNLMNDAARHARNGEYMKWNSDLDQIWIELAGDIKEGDEEDEKYQSLQKELASTGSLSAKKPNGFSKPNKEDLKIKTKQYKILMDKAVFLNRLRNRQGKGTAYEDPMQDYLDG